MTNGLDIRSPISGFLVLALALLQSVLVAIVVISDTSLWIDEFGTWKLAHVTNLQDWWQQFQNWPGSDTQFPLYHFYMYLWARFAGNSEYALRLANVPLFCIAQIGLLWPFRREYRVFVALVAISTAHAFIWYYLNEARAYLMIYLGACATLSAVLLIYRNAGASINTVRSSTIWLLAGGVSVLAGSSLLGVPAVLGALIFVAYIAMSRKWHSENIGTSRVIPVVVLFALLGILGIYYLITLVHGARATNLFGTNLQTLAFSAYELAGLAGFGPGRLAMRGHGIDALKGHLVLVLVGGFVVFGTLAYGLRNLYSSHPRKIIVIAAVCAVTPVFVLFVVGYLMHWRVLGRHLMPLLPVILVVLGHACASLWMSGPAWRRAWVIGVIGLIAFSAVEVKLRQSLDKDDYRAASAVARAAIAAGKATWWVADSIGAEYYHVPMDLHPDPTNPQCPAQFANKVTNAANLKPQCLAHLRTPDVVIISKPDIHDILGVVDRYLRANLQSPPAELPAFQIFRRAN